MAAAGLRRAPPAPCSYVGLAFRALDWGPIPNPTKPMPHPKNRLKLTGDTHAPEVAYEDLREADDDTEDAGWQASAETAPPVGRPGLQVAVASQQPQRSGASRAYLGDAMDQVRARPLACVGWAFALGFVLSRLTR